MEKCEYSCENCANAATVICRLCVATESPSGKVSKPSMFLRTVPRGDVLDEEGVPDYSNKETDGEIEILAYLVAGKPIPLKTVMEYNKHAEEDENSAL